MGEAVLPLWCRAGQPVHHRVPFLAVEILKKKGCLRAFAFCDPGSIYGGGGASYFGLSGQEFYPDDDGVLFFYSSGLGCQKVLS